MLGKAKIVAVGLAVRTEVGPAVRTGVGGSRVMIGVGLKSSRGVLKLTKASSSSASEAVKVPEVKVSSAATFSSGRGRGMVATHVKET